MVLSAAIISPRALQTWHLSQKRSTNPTLIYSHLTAGEVINLSLDRFRRVNYKLEKQEPGMNNSYTYKTAHQLPGTFTAQLYSVLLAVKGGKGDARLGRWMQDQSWFSRDGDPPPLPVSLLVRLPRSTCSGSQQYFMFSKACFAQFVCTLKHFYWPTWFRTRWMLKLNSFGTLQKWCKPTIIKACFKLLSIHPF